MPKPLFRSPEHLVSEWPEVFEDLYISTLPIDYIDLIKLEFNNGRLWEIDLKSTVVCDYRSIEKMVVESFREFKDEIVKLEFSIDISKLKNDIKCQSKRIL